MHFRFARPLFRYDARFAKSFFKDFERMSARMAIQRPGPSTEIATPASVGSGPGFVPPQLRPPVRSRLLRHRSVRLSKGTTSLHRNLLC